MTYLPPTAWSYPPVGGIIYKNGSATVTSGQNVTVLTESIPSTARGVLIKASAELVPGGNAPYYGWGEGVLYLDLSDNSTKQTYQVYNEPNLQADSSEGTLTSSDKTIIPGSYVNEVYISAYDGSTLTIKARDVSAVVDTGVVKVTMEFYTP